MNPIPQTKTFLKIIQFYLLESPVRKRVSIPKADRDPNDPQAKYKCNFKKVSKRGISFEERGLDGAKLNSLRAAMIRVTKVELSAVESANEVIKIADQNKNSEFIVIKKNESNSSVTEGYFYCIRNAFAHGGFDVDGDTYYLKNEDRGEIKGLARIREESLLAWIDLVNMDLNEIKKAGRIKTRSK